MNAISKRIAPESAEPETHGRMVALSYGTAWEGSLYVVRCLTLPDGRWIHPRCSQRKLVELLPEYVRAEGRARRRVHSLRGDLREYRNYPIKGLVTIVRRLVKHGLV